MNKATRPTAYLVQDVFLDRDLGLFRSREEAEEAARAYGETAAVIGVTDDPEVKEAWDQYRAALGAAAARAEEAARAALAGRSLPEGWRVVVRHGGEVHVEQRRWVFDAPGGDIYAHGEETESVGSLEWVPAEGGDQMPQAVREAVEAASAAASAVPRPTAPELLYAPEIFPTPASARPATASAWAEAAIGYWLLAEVARQRRLWRQMREAVEAAREAEKRADPMLSAVFGAPELGAEARQAADLARREGRERAEAARRAVLAEIERQDQARRSERQAARERERAERERAIAERRAALPPVGAVVQAEQTYRLRKQAPCLVGVRVGDKYFYANVSHWTGDEAQSGTWTGQVRVISHRAGRAYGRQYDLEVECV